MKNIKERQLANLEFDMGTIRIHQKMDAKYASLWTLCGTLCAHVLQTESNDFMTFMTGIYFINATVCSIKLGFHQYKFHSLKKKKKILEKTYE